MDIDQGNQRTENHIVMTQEEYNKKVEEYQVDIDGDQICSHWPMWGRGTYSILYKTKTGEFIYEMGVSEDGLEEEIWEFKKVDVDWAKEYIKDYLENSAGLDPIDDLDELFKIWKDIFGEDIKEW